MIKTLMVPCPYAFKLELRDVPTGKKYRGNGGIFGIELQEYETRLVPVPDYPETNKRLVQTLCDMINEHAVDLGEIKRVLIEGAPDSMEYRIYINGAYANYKKSVGVEWGFGEDGEERTPLSNLMREFKMVFHAMLDRMGDFDVPYTKSLIKNADEIIDDYITRMEEYES